MIRNEYEIEGEYIIKIVHGRKCVCSKAFKFDMHGVKVVATPLIEVLPSCTWIEDGETVKLEHFQLHSKYQEDSYKRVLKGMPQIKEELVKPDVMKNFYAYINDF